MKRLLLILLIVPLLGAKAYAEESESTDEILGVEEVSETLPEPIRELAGPLRVDGSYDTVGALERLWNELLSSLTLSFRAGIRESAAVFGIILLATAAAAFVEGQKESEYIQIASCASVSCLLADGIGSSIGNAGTALTTLSDYSKAVLPCIYTVAGTAGAPGSASVRYAAASFALELMMALSQRMILPLVYGCLSLSICAGIYDSPLFRSILKLGKKLAVLTMSLMTMGFTALLGIVGIVSQSADAAAARAAGTVIRFALPVVGRLMTDAASSVISAAELVKNSIGAFGLIAVAAVCLSPFALFAVRRLLLQLLAAAAEIAAGDRLSKLLNELSSVMGLLLGLIGSYGLMLFFSIVAAIRTVSG